MSRRRNQAPAHREQFVIVEVWRRLVGRRDAHRHLGIVPQRLFDLELVHRADAHVNAGRRLAEVFQDVDEQIPDQILAGRDPDFARAALDVERAAELLRALEETDGVWQEAPPLVGEQRRSARPAALAVQLDAEALFEGQQPVSQALFRDAQHRRRRADLPLPRQLDERADLIGAEGGKGMHRLPEYTEI